MKQFDNATPHLSSVYDNQVHNTIPNYECFHQEVINIVNAAGINPKVWLDTGAGTGTLVKRCVDMFPKTLFLLADPSREMLGEAKLKLAGYGTERVRFLAPVETQSICTKTDLQPDVITAIQSHHYLSSAERKIATKVCFDTLNEGGMFITFENIRPFTEKGIEIGKKNWSCYQLSKGKSDEQVQKHMERFGTEYFPITVEEHVSLYRECGFKTVELLWYSYMQAGFYCIKA
jgi:tRNA (cmo5U34)-methyltransferase